MPRFVWNFRSSLLAGAALLCLTPGVEAATFIVTGSDSAAKTIAGGDTGTIDSTGNLTVAGSPAITWDTSGGSTAAVVNNSGTISSDSRAIDESSKAKTAQSFTLNNLTATSLVTSSSDAFRINKDIAGGTVTVNNAGTISSTGAQQALDFAGITSAATVNITNNANAFLTSAGDTAVKLGGANFTIVNNGTVQALASGSRGIDYNPDGDLSGLKSYSLTNGSATNSAALISTADDGVRITAGVLTGASLTAAYNVTVDNFGTIQTNGAGSGQAIDFSDLVSSNGSVHVINEVSGVLSSADADGMKAGNNSILDNYGKISSSFVASTTTPTGNTSGNDGVDFGTNAGTINNYQTGSITGARHGITGKSAITVDNYGSITGRDGSGLNMDTTTGVTTVNNYATGVITGNAVNGDGDAIDVDYLVNITNSGKIQAVGIDPASADSLNEALAIGGGTVTNNQGGLIVSDERAITVDNSDNGNAFGVTTIDNAGTITGKNGQAIAITSTFDNTLTNRATGVINGSVAMGAGNDTVNLYAGSTLNGALDGGAGNDTIHLTGTGKGNLTNVSNVENLKVDSGTWSLTGNQSYSAGTMVAAGATAKVSGTLSGNVTNYGTVAVENGNASFDGTFQNNGALVSDPATLSFNNLSIGAGGYIQAAAGDLYRVSGDFANVSTQNTLWNTSSATLEFTGADGTSHEMQLTGVDMGRHPNVANDFQWGELDLDSGNLLDLTGAGSALYLTDLLGADIVDGTITNITGFNGLVVYYNGRAADNSYLGGLTYNLTGGGFLISSVPEPESWALMILGFGLMGAMMRRRREAAVTA